MSKTTLISIALASCTMGLLCTACKPEGDKQAETQLHQVKVFPITQQKVDEKQTWFGFLSGTSSTVLTPHIQGFIKSQEYKNGTVVKKGDVLFTIEPELFQAAVNQGKANLEAAKANKLVAIAALDKAKLDVERFTKLVAQGAIPEKELLDAKETLKAAEATLEQREANIAQMRAALEKAQIDLGYTIITAPYDGMASTSNVSVGDLVGTNTNLMNVVAINPINVDMAVSSDVILSNFNRGDGTTPVSDLPKFDLTLEDGTVYPIQGTILNIDSTFNENGMLAMNGRIDNPNLKLRAGLPIRTSITMNSYEAMLVPEEAIQETLTNKFIIVVDKQGVPSMLPINIKGNFDVEVEESNGYKSTQNLVSVEGIGYDLTARLKELGYDKVEEATVVTDAINGMYAATVSTQNSRLKRAGKEATGKITPLPFTFKPAPSIVAQKMKEKKDNQGKELRTDVAPTAPPAPVKVMNFIQQDVAMEDEWQGYLRGVEETALRPQITGFLESQPYMDGTMVKKGQVLFTIEQAPFKAALDEAEANLTAAKAAVKQAESNYSKAVTDVTIYKKLNAESPGAIEDKAITDAETMVETTSAALQQAKAAVLQMEALRDTAQINLGYTTITAPFDGLSSLSNPSTGQLVGPNDADPLVNISSVSPIRVDFEVSGRVALEALTKQLGRPEAKEGEKNFQQLDFEIVLENGKTYNKQGKFISANNAIDKFTGTLSVIGHIENEEGLLRTGMPVRVRTKRSTEQDAIVVPARSPIDMNGKTFLMMVGEDQAPILLPITKGKTVRMAVTNADGSTSEQPMILIDADREMMTGMILGYENAENLEDIIFEMKDAKSWSDIALQIAGGSDFRQVTEKMEGKSLPDDTLAKNGLHSWEEYFVRRHGVATAREYVLQQENALDEIELLTHWKGYKQPLNWALDMIGFKDITQVPFIVEGSAAALRTYGANSAANTHVNKVTPTPFIYEKPTTVVPSVTGSTSSNN
ncbi:MAG: efflux RND transporter periplasmic adaptor subunit [Akkermansia sp.]